MSPASEIHGVPEFQVHQPKLPVGARPYCVILGANSSHLCENCQQVPESTPAELSQECRELQTPLMKPVTGIKTCYSCSRSAVKYRYPMKTPIECKFLLQLPQKYSEKQISPEIGQQALESVPAVPEVQ